MRDGEIGKLRWLVRISGKGEFGHNDRRLAVGEGRLDRRVQVGWLNGCLGQRLLTGWGRAQTQATNPNTAP